MIPPAPSFPAAVSAVFRMQTLRLWRGKKIRLGAVALVLVVGSAIIARYAIDDAVSTVVMKSALHLGVFGLLVYLLPFLFTSGALAEEIEGRTFAYLASRPVGRFAITTGKYLSGMLVSAAMIAIAVLVLHVGLFATEPTPLVDEFGGTMRMLGSALFLTAVYCALCLFWGALLPQASGIVSTLHLGLIEFFCASLPKIRVISLNFHATNLAGGALEYEDVTIEPYLSAIALGIALVVFFTLAALIVRFSDFRDGKT